MTIEPDLGRFWLCWRASFRLKHNFLEARQVVVGRPPRGWYRARNLGKEYLGTLRASLAQASENGEWEART